MSPSPETSAAPVSLRGRVIRITFQNPDNGFTVAKVQARANPACYRWWGCCPGSPRARKWNTPVGRSSIPSSALSSRPGLHRPAPRDSEGIKRYLASGLIKGVGPRWPNASATIWGPTP